MEIGFTGTRSGMTATQKDVVWRALSDVEPDTVLHHGACVGADEQMHRIFREHVPAGKIVAHPPDKGLLVASWTLEDADEVRRALPYLKRNMNIVREGGDLLIATPAQVRERSAPRSGTWATVRHGRFMGRVRLVIAPDGSEIERYGWRKVVGT